MSDPQILIAGVGNIFLGDDAFGTEVARRMLGRPMPSGVRVVDFGICGFDLTYALLDGYDVAILIDATPRGGAPGTLYVIEVDQTESDDIKPTDPLVDAHGMDPVKVLRLVRTLGGGAPRVLVVGCEPQTIGSEEDPVMGLSAPVEAAAEEAMALIDSLVERLRVEPLAQNPRAATADDAAR
jgi:hydrogenase maturation protease